MAETAWHVAPDPLDPAAARSQPSKVPAYLAAAGLAPARSSEGSQI